MKAVLIVCFFNSCKSNIWFFVKEFSLALDLIGSWLLPGFGYLRKKRYARALILFIIIEGTFFLGLVLKGSVTPPILDPSGGGVISFLSFLIQVGNGLLSIISFAAVFAFKKMGDFQLAPGPFLAFFAGEQPHAFFEMGGFYLLVSGAMNYFSVVNFYDRYKNGRNGCAIEAHKS